MSTPVLARPDLLSRLLRAAAVTVAAAAMVTGTVAPASAAAVPAAVRSTPTLRFGAQGAAVKWVQQRLHVRPTSGWFGPKTRAAVAGFQRSHHIAADGVVSGRTWVALGVRPAARVVSRSAVRTMPLAERSARVLALAARQSGKPYRYGAAGPNAFDCSGLVSYVYRAVGVSLPHSAAAIRTHTRPVSAAQVRPGDLVFVHSHGSIYHVAIYAGNGYWFEASNPRTGIGRHKAWTRSVVYGRVA